MSALANQPAAANDAGAGASKDSGWIEPLEAGSGHFEAVAERARSARSTCRACGHFIGLGELRLGFDVALTRRAPGHAATSWRHVRCFHAPRGFHLDKVRGLGVLSPEERRTVASRLRELEREARAGPPPAKPLTRTRTGAVAVRDGAGRRAAAAEARAHKHPDDSRFLLSPAGNAAAVKAKYGRMQVRELKEVLKANEQLSSGPKAVLQARCVDGELQGGLPACPRCERGRIFIDAAKGNYACPGYWDSDASAPIHCGFEADHVDRLPWAMPGGQVQRAPGGP